MRNREDRGAADRVDRDARALELTERCLDLDSTARADLLDGLAREDGTLAETVRRLLARGDAAGDWMPTEGPGLWASESAQVPERIGAWRITGVIGEGGMGLVLRGERDDGVFHQIVAIKLIRGSVASIHQHERFLLERQILARLDSPAICRVLDGGSFDGRPYLVMEYVDGVPLTVFAHDHMLDLAQRLRLFRAVCAAVQEAHRRLIVHADLKPSNILVTIGAGVKLLDFGIARLIDESDAVPAGGVTLTRAYAAPELSQSGRASVASDVYSLGVVLRELLTNDRTGGEDGGENDGDHTDPPVPARLLRGDLHAIIAKATAVEVAARYPDIAALIADIDAWFAHQPVGAANPQLGYRIAKFIRRHRTGLALTVAVGMLLAVATAFSIAASIRTERARAEAAARFDDARGAARYLLFSLIDELAERPRSLALRSQVAENAQHYLDRLSHSRGAPPGVRFEAASGLWKLANAQGVSGGPNLGDPARAIANLERAATITQTLAGTDAELLLARIRLDQARTAMDLQFDLKTSDTLLGEARAIIRRAAPEDRALNARYWLDRSKLLGWQGAYRAATVAAERSLALQPRTDDHAAFLLRAETADALIEAIYYDRGPGPTEPLYRDQIAILARAQARWPGDNYVHFRLAKARYNLVMTLLDEHRPAQALPIVEQAIADSRAVLAFDPDDYAAQRNWRIVRTARAQALSMAGERDRGIAQLQTIAADTRALWDAHYRDTRMLRDYAFSSAALGEALDGAGRRDEACAADRQSTALYEEARRAGALTGFDLSNNLAMLGRRIARNCSR